MTYEIWDVNVSKFAGWNACLSYMVVKLEHYHPMLEWFAIIMSHLRDEPGAPMAHKTQVSSSHELIIAAVDPEPWLLQNYEPTLEPPPKLLMPLDIVHQFSNLTDGAAKNIALEVANAVATQYLAPDRERFHDWLGLFNTLAALNKDV